MTTSQNNKRLSGAFLLVAGSILIFFTFMRFGIGELGWVVYAPFLVFIHERTKFKQHLLLFAILVIAFILTVSKMATSEIPWAPVPMFAIPMAFSYFVSLYVAGLAYRRLGARWSVYTFASMTVVMGWIQYSFTPGASWGILANTQINNLPLIQLAAITGLGGITFLVALGSGLAAAAWNSGIHTVRKDIAAFAVILFCVLLYGQLRLSETAPGKTIRVGGVVSPVTHKEFFSALQNIDTLRSLDNELFARTERAASLGAKVVVWNEVATVVTKAGEEALMLRGQKIAKEKGILLCMAYAVAVTKDPFYYVNKYRLYLPDGIMADEYIKRHPVPGDQHDAGYAHARVINFDGINFSGGICYDYSFPEIARDNANDGADIVLIPAADWRGIDREHSRMARMSSVAAGLSMIRPVRASESIACDQYGRLLGSLPWSNSGDGVFVATLSGARVPTIFTMTGEVFPLFTLAFIVLVLVLIFIRRKVVDPEH
jgi:apolipoprotein N-acyltransferase